MCKIRTKFGPNFQGGMVFSGPNTIFWSKMYDLNPDQLEPFQGRCVRDPDQRGLGGRPPPACFFLRVMEVYPHKVSSRSFNEPTDRQTVTKRSLSPSTEAKKYKYDPLSNAAENSANDMLPAVEEAPNVRCARLFSKPRKVRHSGFWHVTLTMPHSGLFEGCCIYPREL